MVATADSTTATAEVTTTAMEADSITDITTTDIITVIITDTITVITAMIQDSTEMFSEMPTPLKEQKLKRKLKIKCLKINKILRKKNRFHIKVMVEL